jgi:hypothetical protein
MPLKVTAYRVLIASPSDLEDERRIATEAINDFNEQHAIAEEVVLLPTKWETHARPQSGFRPQGAINEQIVQDSDILIGMFWTKLGSPTGVADSGTVEEIDQFVGSRRPALLYFSKRPIDPDKIDMRQFKKLKTFKEATLKTALVGRFSGVDELRLTLQRDLLKEIRAINKRKPSTRRRGKGGKASRLSSAWRERDELELYVIACLSVGKDPSLPINEEPQLTRLRLLKDAIRKGELRATLSPSSPTVADVWATVGRKALAKFANRTKHEDLMRLVSAWNGIRPDPESLKVAVRLRLAQLRTEGVVIRNRVSEVTPDMDAAWIAQTESWNTRLIQVIKRHDRPDAEWFRTLDIVPLPRIILAPTDRPDLFHHYAMHDRRLERLDQLIQKYGGGAGAATANSAA